MRVMKMMMMMMFNDVADDVVDDEMALKTGFQMA